MNRWMVKFGSLFFGLILFALEVSGWAQETASPRAAESVLVETALESAEERPERREGFSREGLESRGIVLNASYTAEGFTSLRGGADPTHGTQYLGSVNTTLELDLSKMHLGQGQVFLSAQQIHGRGINGFGLGAVQTPSSFDNPTMTKLIEAFYSDTYLKDRLTIKAGRQYADTEFDVAENGAEFVNSSYGHIPTVPLPTYPFPDFGASAWYTPTPRFSAGAGVYRGVYPSAQDPIAEAASPSRKGVFTIAEVQWKPFANANAHYSVVRLGAWQQERGAWLMQKGTVTATDPVRNYGVYGTADYSFRKQSSESRAPGIFLQWGWAPADRNTIAGYWGTGVAYPGLIAARKQDSAGLGVTQACLSSGERETVMELFYKWQATKRISVQPDLQWVNNPSGDGRNALLGAVRLAVTL